MLLNHLLEDYQESEGKEEILKKFLDRLWKSKYKFSKYKKQYTYKVKEDLLHNDKELSDLFRQYECLEYTVCKSYYKKRLDSIDYIRIHINNMYGYLFDKDVYYKGQYYKLLRIPKEEYLKTVKKLKEGENVDVDQIKLVIDSSLQEAENIKQICIEKKHEMKWSQYKKLINTYIRRIFDNYIPVHEYEDMYGWEMKVDVSYWSEENYVIKYFCKSLTGYLRNYIRDSKIRNKKCLICSEDIGRRGRYCDKCYKIYRREYKTNKQKEYRKLNVDN